MEEQRQEIVAITSEEEAVIDAVELAKDWCIQLPEEEYQRYEELIAKRETSTLTLKVL